ncbi:ATP-dependent Clp protease adapter ClpS [Pseudokineococcus basanitobsidens]|uniref:ATP-dependent Clp protease adapter protein ClpS n=1 Tax=Pseudokineococcus basanitobsidens TaxID=1926649 RepID=A0ABU8RJI1_9ACTN
MSARLTASSPAAPAWRATAAPAEAEAPAAAEEVATQRPWVTIVWNDPVNLMSYVTYVFQSYFGYSRAKAEELMHDVHEAGRAVVSTGSLEEMERDVEAMHGFGLWATFSHDT